MLKAIIEFSLKNKFIVLVGTALLVVGGIHALAEHSARRHPRPVRHAGHHLHRVAGAGAAAGAGPGHLPDHDQDAVGAPGQGRARLLVLRLLVRLCHLRGRHRSVLGAQPRARVPERAVREPAGRRDAEPGARRHGGRLGVHVHAQLAEARPCPAALDPGLVSQVPALERAGRCGGGLGGRLRQAVPDHRGSGPAARLRALPEHHRLGGQAQQRRGRRPARSRWGNGSTCSG